MFKKCLNHYKRISSLCRSKTLDHAWNSEGKHLVLFCLRKKKIWLKSLICFFNKRPKNACQRLVHIDRLERSQPFRRPKSKNLFSQSRLFPKGHHSTRRYHQRSRCSCWLIYHKRNDFKISQRQNYPSSHTCNKFRIICRLNYYLKERSHRPKRQL